VSAVGEPWTPGGPTYTPPTDGAVQGYGYAKRVPRVVRYVGELPSTGRWIMHLIPVSASRDAIVLSDMTGLHQPRVVKDGELTILLPEVTRASVPVGQVGDAGSGT